MPEPSHPRRTLTVIEGRPENRRMVDDFATAAVNRGWGFHQLLGISSDQIARLDFDGIPLDFVIFREMSRNNYHEVERLMYWLRQNHKICINANIAGGRISTSDKYFQHGLFLLDPFVRQYALPTYEAKVKSNITSLVGASQLHYPLVFKNRHGTAGRDITLINSDSELNKLIDYRGLLVEQYIKPECDYRVFVIGGTAVGIMRKIGDVSNPGDFKAWSGGRQKWPEEDPEVIDILSEIATRAAAISGLEYAGVDIIKEAGTGKYYILETNIAAGWGNSFIEVTGVNIPALVLDWLEDRADAREQTFDVAIRHYLESRQKYLPVRIQRDCEAILNGEPRALDRYAEVFLRYPSRYLYDAGRIFEQLKSAYRSVTESSNYDRAEIAELLRQVESMPFSWAGNFIGPDVGTFHDGAILTAVYLYLLGKIREV